MLPLLDNGERKRMPHDIKIVSAREFVRTNAKGEFDLEETKNLLHTVFSKMKEAKIYDVVLDFREASSTMLGVEVLQLFTHLHHLGSLSNWKKSEASARRSRSQFENTGRQYVNAITQA